VPRFLLDNFAGGLNLRDSPGEIAQNETPSALNWTLDQRGGLKRRKGCEAISVSLPGTGGKAAFIFYSAALDQWLCARESAAAMHLFTRPGDFSGVWTDRGSINASVAAFVSFVDFAGATPKVVLASGVIGSANGDVRTWDGTTLTTVFGLQGSALAVWENRVWMAGYTISTASGNPTTLFACKSGDPATWAVASGGLQVDLRDLNGAALTALGIAGGNLIAFKQRSAYRITDFATGAYQTLDPSAGCMGSYSLVQARGKLYTWGADGLYEWDGVGSGKNVGDKARSLFARDAALVGGVPALCAGLVEDRLLFAYPSAAGGNNDLLLEYDPAHTWLMKHALPLFSANEVSSFARKGADLYMAVRDADVIFKVFSVLPGHDDATNVISSYRTGWLELAGGRLARIIHAQIEGYVESGQTSFKMRVYKDWSLSAYDEYDLTADLMGVGSGINYYFELASSRLHSLGHARSFAFEFVATSTGALSAGVFVDSLALDWIPLER
jgi:hypothetical protein